MHATRRDFLAASAAMTASALIVRSGLSQVNLTRGAPLNILILGGTGFLGPATVDAAQARGHKVTLFNRGRREKYVGVRDNTEKLYGNRDPDKHAQSKTVEGKEVEDESSPKGLKELEGKKWDVVIDNSGYVPRIVKASAELLAPNVGNYIFISTVSVYKNNDKPGKDESDEIGVPADPATEQMGAQFENYGPLKALSEQAAERAMPGRVTNIRPGYIVGPGDTTDRFTYWPVRIAQGKQVLVPGAPQDPVQFIDVRDLAEFIIHCAETKTLGVMNATGPAKPMPVGDLMRGCIAAASKTGPKHEAVLEYIPYSWLASNGVPPGSLPILLPPEGEYAGFHSRSVDKAVKSGLRFRSAEETASALLEWWPAALALRAKVAAQQIEEAKAAGRPAPQVPPADRLRTGLPEGKEAEVIKAYLSSKIEGK
jgi:2'-hydroxyisoflavone reductase